MSSRKKSSKEIRNKFNFYIKLVRMNELAGFGHDNYPRANLPLSPKTDLRNLNPQYLQKCLSEEESYRQRAKEYHKQNMAADISLRKTYERFDKDIREREKTLGEEADKSLQNAYCLFDIDAFGQDMVDAGVEVDYAAFDAWAAKKETEDLNFKREISNMRKNLEDKLKDYSEEVNKDQ